MSGQISLSHLKDRSARWDDGRLGNGAGHLVLLLAVVWPLAAPAPVWGMTWDQVYKLTASDAAAHDVFGHSVAISGSTAVVGAHLDGDNGLASGSAYVFDVITGNELFKLTASDAAANDLFGVSVAVSGDTAVIGAQYDDDNGIDSGAAYVFDVATGNELFKLTASDGDPNDWFGHSVAVSGNRAIVGVFRDDKNGSSSGAAYVFDVTTGNELFKLTASDAAANHFGQSVALSGNTAVVGSYFDDGRSGAAYVFDATTGDELFELTASDQAPKNWFGGSVAVSGNTAVIGALEADGNEPRSGAAYVFDVTTGNELFKLTASDGATDQWFSISVAVRESTAVIGAMLDDDNGAFSGSAYVFDVTTGDELFKLTASDGVAIDQFGISVAVSENTAVVGAFGDDDSSGSAYVFAVVPAPDAAPIGIVILAVGVLRRQR